jgi:hypothetical protein
MTAGEMTAPPRSLEQRFEALELANATRTYRAQVKRDLAAGRRTFGNVINDPMCGSMKVLDVLLALPSVGVVRAMQFLSWSRISAAKTCAGLTGRQRVELTVEVRKRFAHRMRTRRRA